MIIMSKDQGDLGELAFTIKAKELGYNVSKPYSSITPYDLILDNGYQLLKIQVKSTRNEIRPSAYKAAIGKGRYAKKPYQIADVDYFAIYILPISIWYIIPRLEMYNTTVNLYPEKRDHKYSKYLEAWHLIE